MTDDDDEMTRCEQSDDNPPDVDYPDDHSPYCRKDCDHPCHDPYDAWVAQRGNDRRDQRADFERNIYERTDTHD